MTSRSTHSHLGPNVATVQIALQDVLLPSELSGLIQAADARRVQPGEVIVLAIRDYLARENPVSPGYARAAVAPADPA
jgi:hypothetical protein